MKKLIALLFVVALVGCSPTPPNELRFTTDKLYGCKLTSTGCPGAAPCCESFDTCVGMEPAGAKQKQVLVDAKVQEGKIVCTWRDAR